MPALSFKKQFVPYVEDGSKQHSIRAMRKRPFVVGDTLQLYYAQRTAQCRHLSDAPCVKVSDIGIYGAHVWIDGVELSSDETNMLAWRDGFRHVHSDGTYTMISYGCFALMLGYWTKEYGDNIDFKGQMPHWDWSKRTL